MTDEATSIIDKVIAQNGNGEVEAKAKAGKPEGVINPIKDLIASGVKNGEDIPEGAPNVNYCNGCGVKRNIDGKDARFVLRNGFALCESCDDYYTEHGKLPEPVAA